ncbi:MAG TPA: sigma-70 family RNA polymerase sigma factor [Pirellulales bacterium]|nr:sigma-70 family RNA polymerase sigma factor [Pirellulales bacterium]
MEHAPTADISQFVADHHAAVFRYAYRLTGATCDAEDLTQQTFLAAHQNFGQLREPEHGRGWLFAILRSCYLRLCRQRRPIAAADMQLDLSTIPADRPEDLMVDPEELQRAIDDLPDEFKLVVLLFYFEGCSYREISEKLNVPTGTVMSRLSRAKGRLRARLFDTQGEEDSPASSRPGEKLVRPSARSARAAAHQAG